jgi:hypothetical protein
MVDPAMRIALLTVAAAALAALMMSPALSGGFVLDDFPNLALLSQVPEQPSWVQLFILMENGIAGIFGRPIAVFSFLLQAQSWPSDPFAFKLVNLLLHLVNGGLLLGIVLLLGKTDSRWRLATPLLLLLLLVWLLHPIQTSAVFYVVQRMNLLSSLFVLLGLLFYLSGRLLYLQSGRKAALLLMGLAPPLMAVLAVLSKENGVLLFAYIAVLELTLLPVPANDPLFRRLRIGLAFVPLGLMALGLLLVLPQVLPGYELKPFTPGERVLTQFPVLLSYLLAIFLPRLSAYGLFHDNFPVYSSLLSLPVLLSLLLIGAGLVAALLYRRRWPLPAFALLWFLMGHAVESTVLPLELYFEHRNYLPLAGIVLALALALQALWLRLQEERQRLMLLAGVALASLWFAFVSVQHHALWGDPVEQAYAEVHFRPESNRARANLVQMLSNNGQPERAYEIHLQTLNAGSENISDYIRWLEFSCILSDVQQPGSDQLQQFASQSAHDFAAIGILNNLVPAVARGACPAIAQDKLNLLLEALLGNENFEVSFPDLFQLRAVSAAAAGNLVLATQFAGQSYELRPNVSVGLARMRWLIQAGALDAAASMLQRYRQDFAAEISERAGLANQIRLIEQAMAAPAGQ